MNIGGEYGIKEKVNVGDVAILKFKYLGLIIQEKRIKVGWKK